MNDKFEINKYLLKMELINAQFALEDELTKLINEDEYKNQKIILDLKDDLRLTKQMLHTLFNIGL